MCPPQPPYPPNPSPPPPLKLAACPTGTAWKTVYIDAYNALAGFKRGAPYQYAFAASAQECYQAALNDTCAGNPVDFFMYTLTREFITAARKKMSRQSADSRESPKATLKVSQRV